MRKLETLEAIFFQNSQQYITQIHKEISKTQRV